MDNYAQLLKTGFDKYVALPIVFWEDVALDAVSIICEKELILKPINTHEKHLYFILSGSCGILLWKKENYVCTDFAVAGEYFCDYLSLVCLEPTPLQTVAFEKSHLLKISTTTLFNLLEKHSLDNAFWRHALTALYVEKHVQQINFLTLTATEHYRLILENAPEIILQIPQKHIASYLGVTPQSLSRIRKKHY